MPFSPRSPKRYLLSTFARDLVGCGGMSPIENGTHWRQRAKEVLAIAEGVEDQHAKSELLETAAHQGIGAAGDAINPR
jgi:hypothetical protein